MGTREENTDHAPHHIAGMKSALDIGVFSLREFNKAYAPHAQRALKVCQETDFSIEDFEPWIRMTSGINWRAYSGALLETLRHAPGARVVMVLGERHLPARKKGESALDYVARVEMYQALLQACDHAARLGHPTHVICTGGVTMASTVGEVMSSELMKYARIALGRHGQGRVFGVVDEISLNTGDQGNMLGACISVLLAQVSTPVIVVPLLPACHQARFIATMLAGVAKMLPGVLDGREDKILAGNGHALVAERRTILTNLATSLQIVPFTIGHMGEYQDLRRMSQGDEAFALRQSPAEAFLPSKPLRGELVERVLAEMSSERNKAFACPALPPKAAGLFIPSAVTATFVDIVSKLG